MALKSFIEKNEDKYKIRIKGFEDRRGMPNKQMIVNGWHRKKDELLPYEAYYIGIHTTYDMLNTIKKGTTIGCRDIFTLNQVKRQHKLKGIFSGCSSINIPFYDGPRVGTSEYYHENKNTGILSLDTQIKQVHDLIDELSKKELVITDRLHIAMPCIAVGTPVIIKPRSFQQERFTLFTYFHEFPGFEKVVTKECGLKDKMESTFKDAFDSIFL